MPAPESDAAAWHGVCAVPALRRRTLLLCLGLAPWGSGRVLAQASTSDLIAGTVIRIDGERGTVTLRHAPIAHLHLPATTTTFRYFNPALVVRIRVGDAIVFRADRYDGSLRLTAAIPAPPGAVR
ncbi:copper-binding protein [uncultured Aquimonas sp.]|uniref:copper-binding protein n=1 Tax=uncultured Aquimonas sp. TaxID=385483 RepID=UPI0026270D28|nr:copper-binding protein [uncultured Aquimonas sp.]